MFSRSRNSKPTRRDCLAWTVRALLAPAAVRAACPCDDSTDAKPTAEKQTADLPNALRICADPNNLPFSNHESQGFEDKIAALIAADLGLKVEYCWLPERLGFFREAFKVGNSNIVMAAPAGFERAALSDPYYRSSYCFVFRKDGPQFKSFDDGSLRKAKIGIPLTGKTNPPTTYALVKRDLIDNVTGFSVFDETEGRPGEKIIAAVAKGNIDVAIAWGPSAGYFAQKQSIPLKVVPVSPLEEKMGDASMTFAFDICMALRRPDKALKAKVNETIARRRTEIVRILDEFSVPQLPISEHKGSDRDAKHDSKG